MGLLCHLDVIELGFPASLTVDFNGIPIEVPIDYSFALEAFGVTFYDIATILVPVDTGYLRSTIDWESDGEYVCEVWADAEYAQYPEFGTWCQAPQPYFTPAVEQAFEVFAELAQEAAQDAQDELEQEIAAVAQAMDNDDAGLSDGAMSFIGIFIALIIMALLEFVKTLLKDMLGIGGNPITDLKTAIQSDSLSIEIT